MSDTPNHHECLGRSFVRGIADFARGAATARGGSFPLPGAVLASSVSCTQILRPFGSIPLEFVFCALAGSLMGAAPVLGAIGQGPGAARCSD